MRSRSARMVSPARSRRTIVDGKLRPPLPVEAADAQDEVRAAFAAATRASPAAFDSA